MASCQIQSCTSSDHVDSNFSWHMGHGVFRKTASLGAWIHCFFGPFCAAAASGPAVLLPAAPPSAAPISSSNSRDFIQSCVIYQQVNLKCLAREILTRSSTYQLRFWPRFAASAILWLVLKCQSRCRAFFSFPSSLAKKRRPQVPQRLDLAS